jgi:hypothetical protein
VTEAIGQENSPANRISGSPEDARRYFKAVNQYILELQEFIQKMYGVQSMHIDSLRVTQVLQDDTVWDGVIEIFELYRHPKAPIVYAWAQDPNKPGMPRKYFAVLHLNSIDSPEAAVKAAIVQQRRTGEAA